MGKLPGGGARFDAADAAFQEDDLQGLAAYVEARAVPGDVLLVSDPALKPALEQWVQRVPVQLVPASRPGRDAGPNPPAAPLAPYLRAHRRLWFMSPSADGAARLGAHALHVDRREAADPLAPLRVDAYERMPEPLLEEGPPRRDTVHLGGLDLLGWDTLPDPLVAGQGGRVRLIWQVAQRDIPDYTVALSLIGPDGRKLARGDHEPYHGRNPTSSWPFGELAYEPHDLLVDPAAPAGAYPLGITVYDPASGASFPPEGPDILGVVTVARPAAPIAARPIAVPHRLAATGAGLSLLGYTLPEAEDGRWTTGARLPISISLRVDDPSRLPAALVVELVGRFGRVAASAEAPLGSSDDPPGAWQAGDLRTVPLPLELPAGGGDFTLRLRALGSSGRITWLRRGMPALLPVRGLWLRRLAIAEPPRETRVPPMAHRLDLAMGDAAQLLGYDLAAGSLQPSGVLTTTLYWRASGPLPASYRATVQLLPIDPATGDPSGPPIAQHDGVPADGGRPTTDWAPGEVITDRHALTLPADLAPGDYLLTAALHAPDRPDQPRPAVTQGGRTRDHARLERVRVAAPGFPPSRE